MWKLIGTPKTQRVTKKLAEEYATMDPAPHDRPLSERRLQVYERIMQAGQFRPLEWSKAKCTETGGIYRTNGKHTSTLISGMEKIPELHVTLYDYQCDTLDDVAKLYATFDSRAAARSTGDINAAFAGTMPALKDVPIRTVNAVVTGMVYLTYQDAYSHAQPAERAEGLLDNEDFCLFVHEIGGVTKEAAKLLVRAPVVGAMYGTYLKDPEAARKFWAAVRDETGPTPELPDRRLGKFLSASAIVRSGGVSRSSRHRAAPREQFVKSCHAWNAWRRNETTNLNYHSKADVPSFV